MAADDDRSIAEQIDDDPSLVDVTAAADRDTDTDAEAEAESTDRPTWGDIWQHCNVSGVLSKTQAATALEAHPNSGYRNHQPARDRLETAIDNGVLVETGDYGTKVAIEEDCDEYV
jgi:hypothetical protein